MKKIYLAVPYSGMEESSYAQVTVATAKLIEKGGLNVLSPITHSHPLTKVDGVKIPGDWGYWETVDKQFIDWADEVWALVPVEGKEKVKESTGVTAELKYAMNKGKKVRVGTLEEMLKFKYK